MIFFRNHLKSIINGWRMSNKRWQLVKCSRFIGFYWNWSYWMMKIIFVDFTAHAHIKHSKYQIEYYRCQFEVNIQPTVNCLSVYCTNCSIQFNKSDVVDCSIKCVMVTTTVNLTNDWNAIVRLLEDSWESGFLCDAPMLQYDWFLPRPWHLKFLLNNRTRPPPLPLCETPSLSPMILIQLNFPRHSLHSANTSATFLKYLPQKCV